jgi:hypothetical protein
MVCVMRVPLADFFLIVRQVMHTYNPDSAYVDLDHWESSASCWECAAGVHPDEAYFCDECERDFCGDCMGICNSCNECTCFNCLISCEHCDDSHCRHCLQTCAGCDALSCPGCLEDQLCPTCYEERETDDDHENQTPQEGRPEGQPAPTPAVPIHQPSAA